MDLEKAFFWYEKSANSGNIHTQFKCAFMCEDGVGTEKDLSKASDWYEKVVNQGDEDVQLKCGEMCEEGIGVDVDIAKALYWYKKAVLNGNFETDLAYVNLEAEDFDYFNAGAIVYEADDYKTAIELFEESAEFDNTDAQYICGVMYFKGERTDIDETKGLYWLKQDKNNGRQNDEELLHNFPEG